jgi:hypothetical protein
LTNRLTVSAVAVGLTLTGAGVGCATVLPPPPPPPQLESKPIAITNRGNKRDFWDDAIENAARVR